MKKIYLIVALAITANYSSAQEWVKMMKDGKTNFYDVQKAFYEYQKDKEEADKNKPLNVQGNTKEEEHEQSGYEIFKRWEYFMTPRTFPKGERIDNAKAVKEIQSARNNNHHNGKSIGGNWTPIGPSAITDNGGWNPGLGRVNTVMVDKNDTNKVYVGSPAGGFWKSTDGGLTYVCTTDNNAVTGVTTIAIDPNNSNIIFIGTGDGDGWDMYTGGVMKSTDGGDTWTQTGMDYQMAQGKNIYKMMFLPGSSTTIFCATNDGLFKTTDAGATWYLDLPGYFKDMKFKPNDASIMYIAGNAFYKSVDSGNTFTMITAGLPLTTDVNRLSIAVTPANPNIVDVIGGSNANSGYFGLYNSTDAGNHFSLMSNSPNLLGWATDGSDVGGQSWYGMTIAISPNDPNIIFVGGVNVWESIDGGINWNMIAYWAYPSSWAYVHADSHALDFFGNSLYTGCDGGCFRSTNLGANWTDLSKGMQIMQFYHMSGTPQDPNILMGGAQDNGCNRMVGNSWQQVFGADGFVTAIDPTNGQIFYVESQGGGMARTTDGGASYVGISPPNNGGGAWSTPYMLDPNSPETIFAGYVNVWKSTDTGNTWTQISGFDTVGNITSFTVAQSNSNYIYVYRNDTLYKTTDGGATWTNISAGLPLSSIYLSGITVSNTDPNRLWISLSGYSANQKVYGSYDGGATWFNFSGNLPNLPVNCVLYQNNSLEGLYIGTETGVYYRDSSLSNWQPFYNGLPNMMVEDLVINYQTNKIRCATYGRGMWESPLYSSPSAPPVAAFTADKFVVCPDVQIQFTDLSTNASSQWNWSFPGGLPNTSTQQNPIVSYLNTGTYPVQLVAYNLFGTDTAIQNSYITVNYPSTINLPLQDGFETTNFPTTSDWRVYDNPVNSGQWFQANWIGGYSHSYSSAAVNNWNGTWYGSKQIILTPPYDLTITQSPVLKFDIAYARYNSSYTDTLIVFYSNDCGVTQHQLYKKGGTELSTSPDDLNPFTPDSTQWRTETLNIDTIANKNDVQFGFANLSGYGNYMYLDNINLMYSNVGIPNINNPTLLNIYPNPFNNIITISINNNLIKDNEIQVLNVLGEIIYTKELPVSTQQTITIDLDKFSSGIYFVRMKNSDGYINKKIIKM